MSLRRHIAVGRGKRGSPEGVQNATGYFQVLLRLCSSMRLWMCSRHIFVQLDEKSVYPPKGPSSRLGLMTAGGLRAPSSGRRAGAKELPSAFARGMAS